MGKQAFLKSASGALLTVLAGVLLGCKDPTPATEQPEFTRDRPSFTGDRSSNIDSAISFTDITADAGISFTHETGAFGEKWMPETMGSGGGFLDYDNDGWLDILLVNSTTWPGKPTVPSATTKLFRNRGDATFEDVTAQTGLGLQAYGMGASFADFDADGDTDVFITTLGANRLYRNDNGRFTEVSSRMGVAGDAGAWSTSAVWFDYDRDGWLDLFVANYVQWTPETDIYVTRDGKTKSYATPEGYLGTTCRLYRNRSGKSFEDVTAAAGVLNDEGKSLGIALADFNTDNWPDIVVANDTQPNFLYINRADGTFEDLAIQAGIGYDEVGRARAGMGVDVADIANNGVLSIAIGNFAGEPLSLYSQIDAGELFQDRAGAARLSRPSLLSLSFGVRFADFDLDGLQDLIIANGHIEPEINAVQQDVTFAQKPQIFQNTGNRFVEVTDQAGEPLQEPVVGRGLAVGDIDQDGDLDVLLTTNGGAPRLLQNNVIATASVDAPNWVRLQLAGNAPNLKALGATVTAWAGGQAQHRIVTTGSSYLSQSDVNTTVIGLGQNTQIDSLLVRWPTTGETTRATALSAGETHVISETSGR